MPVTPPRDFTPLLPMLVLDTMNLAEVCEEFMVPVPSTEPAYSNRFT